MLSWDNRCAQRTTRAEMLLPLNHTVIDVHCTELVTQFTKKVMGLDNYIRHISSKSSSYHVLSKVRDVLKKVPANSHLLQAFSMVPKKFLDRH